MQHRVFLSGLCAAACVSGLCAASATPAHANPTRNRPALAPPQAPQGKGKLVADYGPPCKIPRHEKLRQALQKAKYLESLAANFNDFSLPNDITVTIRELGKPNAFWFSEKRAVVVSYELMDDFVNAFAQEGTSDTELIRKMFNATEFVFYHEIGHAFISELGLPITGREEDAVDQFSTYMLINIHSSPPAGQKARDSDHGGYAAVDAAKYFALTTSDKIREDSFWDEHSLNQQRFYDILGLVYASQPDAFNYLVKTKMLPPEKAELGRRDWRRIILAWPKLLLPHLK